jgi:transposase
VAVLSVAAKLDCHPETLRNWGHKAERDADERPSLTTSEVARFKELERKNRKLRRVN